jgi:hypothetical protein
MEQKPDRLLPKLTGAACCQLNIVVWDAQRMAESLRFPAFFPCILG